MVSKAYVSPGYTHPVLNYPQPRSHQPIDPVLVDLAEQFIENQSLFLPRGCSNEVLEPNKEWINPLPGRRNLQYCDVWNQSDEEVIEHLTKVENFLCVRKLADHSWVGLMQLMTTLSVCSDITPSSPYAYRWCFRNPEEARYFFSTIKEFDEVPTKRDSLVGHRHGGYGRLQMTDELGLKKW